MNEREAFGLVVGELLRQRREALGISQQTIAPRAGVTQSAISRIERGEYQLDAFQLGEVAAALGLHGVGHLVRLAEAALTEARRVLGGAERSWWWHHANQEGGTEAIRGLVRWSAAVALRRAQAAETESGSSTATSPRARRIARS